MVVGHFSTIQRPRQEEHSMFQRHRRTGNPSWRFACKSTPTGHLQCIHPSSCGTNHTVSLDLIQVSGSRRGWHGVTYSTRRSVVPSSSPLQPTLLALKIDPSVERNIVRDSSKSHTRHMPLLSCASCSYRHCGMCSCHGDRPLCELCQQDDRELEKKRELGCNLRNSQKHEKRRQGSDGGQHVG